MTHQRQQRKGDEIERDRRQPEHLVAADQAHHERRHRERDEPDHIGMGDPWPFAKHGDEGEQIDRQRQHPEERRGSDVGGQMRRHRDHETGRDRGERDPAHALHGGGTRFIPRQSLRRDRRRVRCEQAGDGEKQDKRRKAERPARGLRFQRQERLDDDGIGEQGGKRTEIGRGVEHVGIARLPVPARGKPALQQWRAGRQREERKADRERKQSEQPERGSFGWRRGPSGAIAIGNAIAVSPTNAM